MATYDLTTNIGKTRLLIADTDTTVYDFEDDEVQAAIDMSNNNYGAAALLLRSLAANRARLSVSVKRGTLTEDMKQLATDLMTLANTYEEQSGSDALASGDLETIISPDYEEFSWRRNLMKTNW